MSSTFCWQGEKRACHSARLGLTLETQPLRLLASLEVWVDEDSGQEGAPAPDAHWVMHPLPGELFRSQWNDEAPEFEAWMGYAAPELEDNHISLQGRDATQRIALEWQALCEGEPMQVQGWAEFSGLQVQGLEPEAAPDFLRQLWPTIPWATLVPERLEVEGFGEQAWQSLHYRF